MGRRRGFLERLAPSSPSLAQTALERARHGGIARSRKIKFRDGRRGKVLEEALTLTGEQRARIAHELLDSLEGGGGPGAERARKVDAIRVALAEGEESGIAEDSSLEGILAEFRSSRAR